MEILLEPKSSYLAWKSNIVKSVSGREGKWREGGRERRMERKREREGVGGENIYEYEKNRINPNNLLVLIGVLDEKQCQIYSAK